MTVISTAKRCSYNQCLQRFPITSKSLPLIAFEHLSLSMVIWTAQVGHDRSMYIKSDQSRYQFCEILQLSKTFKTFKV